MLNYPLILAQRAYGDARLWFRIAEANSLQGDQDLRIGQTLTIPNVPAGTHNDQNTTNASNPFNSIGDLTPALPMSQGQGGSSCGGMGAIVTAAIAIAVTVALRVPIGLPGAAAAGSVAGQVAGNALGTQHGFDWKQVALAAIGGQVGESVQAAAASQAASEAASAGIRQTAAQSSGLSQALEVARQAALTSTITQGIGVVTGLQSSFSWKGVVASAAGAGVSNALGAALTNVIPGTDIGSEILRGTLNATAAGTTTALLQGGKLNTVQIASDAFGNALGYAFVDRTLASARPASVDVEAQYWASSYAANAYSADDYGNNVNDSNPAFYSDTEANQDLAREQLRFSAAQTASVLSPVNTRDRLSSKADRHGQRDYMPALAEAAANASTSLNQDKSLYVEISGILPENRRDDPDSLNGNAVDDVASKAERFATNVMYIGGDLTIGALKGVVNLIPETAALVYRGVGYAQAGLVSLVNTELSDRMFAHYEKVSGRLIDYENPVQEVGGFVGGMLGPQTLIGVARSAYALENGVSRVVNALSTGSSNEVVLLKNQVGSTNQATELLINKASRTIRNGVGELGQMANSLLQGQMLRQGMMLRAVEASEISSSLLADLKLQHVPHAGGVIRRFIQTEDQVYYRVFSENSIGSFLTAVPPRSSAWAQEALALPVQNKAIFIQKVLVPAGTKIERSRALPAFGKRGGAEQFELLDKISKANFGLGEKLP